MSAILSKDGKYRYQLDRTLGHTNHRRCAFIMLNPSTADATTDDATIKRCIGFARRFQCSKLRVVNLFAWRATDPRDLYHRELLDIQGNENRDYLHYACEMSSLTICGWGAHGSLWNQGRVMQNWLLAEGFALHALKVLKSGEPAHPLYLKRDSPLIELGAR